PVIVAFVYYECPMLCTLIMNGVASSLSILSLTPGEDFEVVAISIDHEETPEHARQAEATTLQRYGQPDTHAGWHFLTGDQETVSRLAATAGFGFEYIPATDEWAHASAVMVATPEGQLSQYFYGVEYPPKDLRLAMVEASDGTIGSIVDQILLYCYRYDPQIGKYTVMTMRILRITGALFSVGLILFMWVSFRRDRRASEANPPTLGAA
ncbi:MAG: SCO family protein, partial [Acidobacteriota bacterium]